MKKMIFIFLSIIVFFMCEFFLYNLVGLWFVPNLLLLLVVFLAIYDDLRISIIAAVCGGLLIDSFGFGPISLNAVSFVACAFLTSALMKYIHHSGSRRSTLLIVLIVVIVNFLIHYAGMLTFSRIRLSEALRYVLLPEGLATMMVSLSIFKELKKCALKLSVL